MTDDKNTRPVPGASPIPPKASLTDTLDRASRVEKLPAGIRNEYDNIVSEYGNEAGLRFLEKYEKEVAEFQKQKAAEDAERQRVEALSDRELYAELNAIRTSFVAKAKQLRERGLKTEIFLTSFSGSILPDGKNSGELFGMRVYREITDK